MPVIENIDLVLKWHFSGFEVRKSRRDLARRHVPCRIVLEANDQDARVGASRHLDNFVHIEKSVMVSRHEDERLAHRMKHMPRIQRSRKIDRSRVTATSSENGFRDANSALALTCCIYTMMANTFDIASIVA